MALLILKLDSGVMLQLDLIADQEVIFELNDQVLKNSQYLGAHFHCCSAASNLDHIPLVAQARRLIRM